MLGTCLAYTGAFVLYGHLVALPYRHEEYKGVLAWCSLAARLCCTFQPGILDSGGNFIDSRLL